jgi:hypothetical protein
MIHSKCTLVIVLVCFITVSGWGQQTYKSCYGFDCKEKKWSLSFFAGFSLLGPTADIKNQFEESSFADPKPLIDGILPHILTQAHPRSYAGLIWNIEAQYLLTPKSALGITIGTINHNTTTGYDSIGSGNSLKLRTTTYSTSIRYSFRLRQGKDDLSFGPVLARLRTQNDASGNESVHYSPYKAGFSAGYSFSILQKESWFISLKANYTWLPTAEIGPYTKEHKPAINQEIPKVYRSVFEQTDVRLSSFYIGVSTGWRW